VRAMLWFKKLSLCYAHKPPSTSSSSLWPSCASRSSSSTQSDRSSHSNSCSILYIKLIQFSIDIKSATYSARKMEQYNEGGGRRTTNDNAQASNSTAQPINTVVGFRVEGAAPSPSMDGLLAHSLADGRSSFTGGGVGRVKHHALMSYRNGASHTAYKQMWTHCYVLSYRGHQRLSSFLLPLQERASIGLKAAGKARHRYECTHALGCPFHLQSCMHAFTFM